MKKTVIISLLIFQSLFSFGQELKTKKKKINDKNGIATFSVLGKNKKVKHGDYQIKSRLGNRILIKGTYYNNKKEGFWAEQYDGPDYRGPKANGYYENDIKTGDWTYFNYEGNTVMVYNWTDKKVVFSKICGTDKSKYNIIEDNVLSTSTLDCPPTCATGREYFHYELNKTLKSQSRLFKKIGFNFYQLNTKIAITIDKDGTVTEITYSTDESIKLKNAIEKLIKSQQWIPGKKEGKDVTTKLEFGLKVSNMN